MKNYLKFIVAVFGITIATFGSITTLHAKAVVNDGGSCYGESYTCGTAQNGGTIIGVFKAD